MGTGDGRRAEHVGDRRRVHFVVRGGEQANTIVASTFRAVWDESLPSTLVNYGHTRYSVHTDVTSGIGQSGLKQSHLLTEVRMGTELINCGRAFDLERQSGWGAETGSQVER